MSSIRLCRDDNADEYYQAESDVPHGKIVAAGRRSECRRLRGMARGWYSRSNRRTMKAERGQTMSPYIVMLSYGGAAALAIVLLYLFESRTWYWHALSLTLAFVIGYVPTP